MPQIYHRNIPITGAAVLLQPAWEPHGLIVSNYCDAVIAVTDGRGNTWRVPPGRTIRRPLFIGSGPLSAAAETSGTTGEALVVLTEDVITEIAGEDASIGTLFRRKPIDQTIAHTSGGVSRLHTFDVGAARYAQISAFVQVSATDGLCEFILSDVDPATGAYNQIALATIPHTYNNFANLNWTCGPGGVLPMPRGGRLAVNSIAGTLGSPSNTVYYRVEVWEAT